MRRRTLQLRRIEKNANGYFGIARLGRRKFFSCEERKLLIGEGKYRLMKHHGKNHQKVFCLEDFSAQPGSGTADGRKWILIHIGNTEEDTIGCILLALGYLRDAKGKLRLLDSGKAIRRLWRLKPKFIELKEASGTPKTIA